jgi:hypothetical protein
MEKADLTDPMKVKAPSTGAGNSAVLAGDVVDANRLKPVPDPRNTPMIVDPLPEPRGDVAKMTEKEEEIAPDPAEKKDKDMSAVDQVKMAVIREGVEKVQRILTEVPAGEDKLSPDDAQSVVNAYDQTERLLTQVEEVRGDSGEPLVGDLGDLWWELINLKTQAVKISRRAPDSLALNPADD